MGVVVLASGGVDSTVLLARAVQRYELDAVLWFHYGQPAAVREFDAVRRVLEALDVKPLLVLDEVPIGTLWSAPMQAAGDTGPRVVPGRNLVMLAHALNHAASVGADEVWFGAMLGDAVEYPDCRREFVDAVNVASCGGAKVSAPLMPFPKSEVIRECRSYGLLDLAWSCYEAGPKACGVCASCRDREAAELSMAAG